MVYNINDEQERRVFKRLPREEQMAALYEIMSHNRTEQQAFLGRLANIEKKQIEFDDDLRAFKRELRAERESRKEREKKLSDLLDTTPPVKNMTPEQKQSTIDKITAIVTKQDEKWMPLIREALRIIVILIGLLVGKNLIP